MTTMVYCRGCGKEIHETAPTCPHCGAPQLNVRPIEGVSERSTGKLIGWAIVWTFVFWVGGLIIAGFAAGVTDPANGGEAGSKAGEACSIPFLVLSIIVSTILTILGKLPGTRKK